MGEYYANGYGGRRQPSLAAELYCNAAVKGDSQVSHCVYIYTVSQKNIPDIFNFILKTNYQILIISGTNIPDTTCHQMTIQFPTSPIVCFCTT